MSLSLPTRLAIDAGRFDLVIFDCDGVVIDSEVLSCAALQDQLARHGMAIDLDDIFARFLGRSFKVVAEEYARRCGRPMPEALVRDLRADLFGRFARELRPIPGAAGLLASLALPYCLISSSDAERLRVSLGAAGLAQYFGERVFNAAMVERGKPAPDLFLHAARAMGAKPARALVIEDSACGIEAAKAAGMTAWGFVGGGHYARRDGPSLLAEAGADRVFASMADLDYPVRQH